MSRLSILFLAVLLLGGLLLPDHADARRFGGGSSLGKQGYSYDRSTPPAGAPAAPGRQASGMGAGAAAPAQSGISRWLGPLAGLAAGGLLASMFFGDGFSGIQPMDLLLIAGVAFLAFTLLKRRHGGQPAPAGGPALREAAAPSPPPAAAEAPSFATPEIGAGLRGAAPGARPLEPHDYPSWFDRDAFLRGAKEHFLRLQAAWDKGDMRDIREYTTPELFAQLTLERQAIGGSDNFTEVVELEAELLGLLRDGDRLVAGIRYSGLIREERNGTPQRFAEVWHIQRAEHEAGADWYVAGIEQPPH